MPRTIDWEPIGKRTTADDGQTLLEVAQHAGIGLASICGGIGACDACRIRIISGRLSAPTITEEGEFTREELREGWRLACQAEPLSDVKIDIPPESLTAPQRLQIESARPLQIHDSAYQVVDVALSAPTLANLRPDTQRLHDALADQGIPAAPLALHITHALADLLRRHDWQVRVVLYEDTVIAVLPPQTTAYGVAIDIGTTGMAGYLIDFASGGVITQQGAMNPQIAYGEDVISRIKFITDHPQDANRLQRLLIATLNEMLAALCDTVQASPQQVVSVVLVGNTTMHHIAVGLPVQSLGEAPYVPITNAPLMLSAQDLGLNVAPHAPLYLPPNIAGYVGGDHVAMLLGVDAPRIQETAILIDIGTNTEVTLMHQGRMWCCSCASGPAFEGAHIRHGMRAANGAIERVRLIDGDLSIQTIGDVDAIGICGSGILDAVAVMASDGMLKPNGGFASDHPRLSLDPTGKPVFVLANAITLTRKDVAEIQLAKAAIRAGIEILLETAHISASDVQRFVIAGAFGSYIDIAAAIKIGMFPPLPLERFEQVGNAAGLGACQLLLSAESRHMAGAFIHEMNYIELTTVSHFQDHFVQYMPLENSL